jgi:hypothetical protein
MAELPEGPIHDIDALTVGPAPGTAGTGAWLSLPFLGALVRSASFLLILPLMRTPPLRSIFSSILLGHLGLASAVGGCVVVVDEEPDGQAGSAGAAGSAGTSGAGGSAGVSGAGGAGGGEPTPVPISTVGFDPFTCPALFPGGLDALGVDSIELWQNFGAEVGGKRLESEGAFCAGAIDQAVCFAALDAARAEPWDGPLSARFVGPPGYLSERLVTAKGGDVAVIDDYYDL